MFEKRSKHPPKTNVNAVLSFLYYLLSEEVEFAIQSEGLDCNAGTLHEIQQGRKSLVYDLMEDILLLPLMFVITGEGDNSQNFC